MSDDHKKHRSRESAAQNAFIQRRVAGTAVWIAACSMVTLFARQWWIADLIANLRVQLILLLSGALLLTLIMRRRKTATFVAAVTLWHASAVSPAFLPEPGHFDSSNRSVASTELTATMPAVRVLLANVLTGNRNHDQIVEQIQAADPDVFAILELSSSLEQSLVEQFGSTHKYVVSEPSDGGNFGIGLWSRYPLLNDRVFHLSVPIVPSIEADVQLPTQTIRVIVTHPVPPMGSRNFAHRNFHLELLAQRIRKYQDDDPIHSVILLGDLNLTPWSPIFHDFQASTRLENAAAGQGLQPTWYRWDAFPFGLVLDHGMHSHDLDREQRTILSANGSDHRPLVMDFSLAESR